MRCRELEDIQISSQILRTLECHSNEVPIIIICISLIKKIAINLCSLVEPLHLNPTVMSLISLLLWGSDSEQLWIYFPLPYRSLLASLSDSRSVSTSPSLTGPFTFLMMERLLSSMNSTRTCKWQEAKQRQILVALVELWKLWYRHHTSYSHHREDPYNTKWGPNIASEWAPSHCMCINPNTDRQSSNLTQVSLNKEMVVEIENGLKADRIFYKITHVSIPVYIVPGNLFSRGPWWPTERNILQLGWHR